MMALGSAAPTRTTRRGTGHGVGRPLAALALAVIVFMQVGTFARPLGEVGPVRAADWLDLLTPWAVVGAAAWVLVRCRTAGDGAPPDRLAWGLLAVGGLAFAEGKGLHLAANSVGNSDPHDEADGRSARATRACLRRRSRARRDTGGALLRLVTVVPTVMLPARSSVAEPPAAGRTPKPGTSILLSAMSTLRAVGSGGKAPCASNGTEHRGVGKVLLRATSPTVSVAPT